MAESRFGPNGPGGAAPVPAWSAPTRWTIFPRAEKIDDATALLKIWLHRMNSGGPQSLELNNSLYPDAFMAILRRIFGEIAERDTPSSIAAGGGIGGGVACWIDWMDGCKFRTYEELKSTVPAEIQNHFTVLEIRRCRAALNTGVLLTINPSPGSAGPLIGEEVREPALDSFWFDDPKEPIFFSRALLPPQTQRILEWSKYHVPEIWSLHGGMHADPFLETLLDKYTNKLNTPLLLTQQRGALALTNGPGKGGKGGGKRGGTADAPLTGAAASGTSQQTVGGLSLRTRDIMLLMFINFVVSKTRKYGDVPVDQDLTGPRAKTAQAKNLARPLLGDDSHRVLPLAYKSIESMTHTCVYLDVLYDYVGNMFLPTHVRFGESHSDTRLFLNAIISYWLMQNPPYQRPLPGQTTDSASSMPISSAEEKVVAQIVAQRAAAGAAIGPGAALVLANQQQHNPAAITNKQRQQQQQQQAAAAAAAALVATPFSFPDGSLYGPAGIDTAAFTGAQAEIQRQEYVHASASGGGLSLRSSNANPTAVGRGGVGEAPTMGSSSSSGGGGAKDIIDMSGGSSRPVPLASAYIPPTLDLLEATTLLLTMQMCDEDFQDVIDGTDGKIAKTGGERIVDLALRNWQMDAYSNPQTIRDVEWNLARCPSLAAGPRADVRMLHNDIPGMILYPPVFQHLHAPLFHFFRNHLDQSLADGGAQIFVSTVDAWMIALSPWRARPRYKGKLPSYDSVRSYRAFSYNQQAGIVLRQQVAEMRQLQGGGGQQQGGGGRQSGRVSKVIFRSPTLLQQQPQQQQQQQHALQSLDVSSLLMKVRDQGGYDSLWTSTHDFESGYIAAQGDVIDPKTKKVTEKRLFRSSVAFEKWVSWIRLHYLFYSHLLYIVFDKLRGANFSAQDGMLVLGCLERVIDFLEPSLVRELQKCDAQWSALYNVVPLRADKWRNEFTDRERQLRGNTNNYNNSNAITIAAAPVDKEQLSIRIQLLAHRNLLKLPPDVSPRSMQRPMNDILQKAEDILGTLRRAIDAASIGRPAPIEVPEGCRIEIAGNEVYENPPYWERMEQIVASILSLVTAPLAFLSCLSWDEAYCQFYLQSCGSPADHMLLLGLPIQPLEDNLSRRLYIVRLLRSHFIAKQMSEYIIYPIEGVITFIYDMWIGLRDLAYSIAGYAPPVVQQFPLRPGADAERVQIVIDRLRILCVPALSKHALEIPSFFYFKQYKRKTLSQMLWEKILDWYRWIIFAAPPPRPVGDLLEPRLPANYLRIHKLEAAERAAIVGGRGRLDGFQQGYVVDDDDSYPAHTWESTALIRLDAWLSAVLSPLITALLVSLRNILVKAGWMQAPAPGFETTVVAFQGNFFRRWRLADLRILLLIGLCVFSSMKIGVVITFEIAVLMLIVLRCLA